MNNSLIQFRIIVVSGDLLLRSPLIVKKKVDCEIGLNKFTILRSNAN